MTVTRPSGTIYSSVALQKGDAPGAPTDAEVTAAGVTLTIGIQCINTNDSILYTRVGAGSWIASSAAAGSGHTIQAAGVSLIARSILNVVGPVVSASDDVVNSKTLISFNSGIPVAIGTANATGVAGTGSLSDHVHAHGQVGPVANAHALSDISGTISQAQHGALGTGTADHTGTLTGNARVAILNNGAAIGTRRALNLIPGVGTTILAVDNSVSERVDITITAGGAGSGYTTIQNAGTPLTARSTINITTPVLSASDDVGGARTLITFNPGVPTAIGTANAQGSAGTGALSDHVHSHGAVGATPNAHAMGDIGGSITQAQHGALTTGAADHTGTLTGNARSVIWVNTVNIATRRALNLIAGAGTTIAGVDNPGAERVDVTITAGGGAGYTTVQNQGVSLTARSIINFVGAAVVGSDDGPGVRTLATISTTADTFTEATKPSAGSFTGRMIRVSDGLIGAELQYSNGTIWIGYA